MRSDYDGSDRARPSSYDAGNLWRRVESWLMLAAALAFAALHYHGVMGSARAVWAAVFP